jgi:hypothetical protein
MPGEWSRLAGASDLKRQPSGILVTLPSGRRHFVRVNEEGSGYYFEAVVAGPRVTQTQDDPCFEAWTRNRFSRVVGYRVDVRGRLLAQGWTPRAGTTERMFQLLVRTVAQEADRHEFLLTGADRR